MRKVTLLLTVLFVTALYHAPAVLAQSSGSFSTSFNPTQCSRVSNTEGPGAYFRHHHASPAE
jgi:hypothetical protein